MLIVLMQSVIMLNVVMQCVILLNVIMLSLDYFYCYSERSYAECHYAGFRFFLLLF
jgi:hypothetical protein